MVALALPPTLFERDLPTLKQSGRATTALPTRTSPPTGQKPNGLANTVTSSQGRSGGNSSSASPSFSAGDDVKNSNISIADNRAAQAGNGGTSVVGSGNDFSNNTNVIDESTSSIDTSQTTGHGGIIAGGAVDQSRTVSNVDASTHDNSVTTSNVDASVRNDNSVRNIDQSRDNSVTTSNVDASVRNDNSVRNIDRSVTTSNVDASVRNIDRSSTISNVDASTRNIDQSVRTVDRSQTIGDGGIANYGDLSQAFHDNSQKLSGKGNIGGDYIYTDATDLSRTVVDHRTIDSSRRVDRSVRNTTNTVSDFGAIAAGSHLGALSISAAEQNNIRSLETNLRFGQLAIGAAERASQGVIQTGRENSDKAFQLALGAMGQNKEVLLDSIATVAEASKSETLQVAQGNQKTIMAAFAMVAAIFIFGMRK